MQSFLTIAYLLLPFHLNCVSTHL
jgi:hypothetical protein